MKKNSLAKASLSALFVISVMFTDHFAVMFAEEKQRVRRAIKRPKKVSVKCFIALAIAVIGTFSAAVDLLLILGSEFTGEMHYENDIGSFGQIAGEENGGYYSTEQYTDAVKLLVSDDYNDTIFFKYLAASSESRHE